jgi:hypothetical protein
MNQEDSADFTMQQEIEDILIEYTTPLSTLLPLVPKMSQFGSNMDAIIIQKGLHEFDKSGYRPANVLQKKLLSATMSRYSILGADYFIDNALPAIARQLEKKHSLLEGMKNADLVTYCNNNVAIFVEYETPLAPYGINPALVTILNGIIDNYDDNKNNPRSTQIAKNLAGKTERELLDANDVILHSFDRLIPNFFKDTQPTMVGLYEASRKKNILGRRHNNLAGLIIAAITLLPLENVIVKNLDLKKEIPTDIDGNYLLAQMTPGKYHFSITLPGYVTINVIIEIIFRTTVIQNFTMTLA